MSEPNLVKYMSRFSLKEKAVLLRLIKELPAEQHHHLGTLPFISLHTAKGMLALVASGAYGSEEQKAYRRIAKEILQKLDWACPEKDVVMFFMRLNDKKVYRHFGRQPEKGKPLNFLPKVKVTVGVKYHLPSKNYIPDEDVLVAPSVALKKRDDLWEVTVLERCRARVEAWLQQNCQ